MTRPITRRAFLGGTAALSAPLVAAACGGGSGGGGKTKVRMWTWYSEQQSVWPQVIKDFEKAHPNITIENRIFGDTNSYLPALQASVSAGEPPDIFGPHVLAIQYGKAGIALDLKDALGSKFLSGFFPSTNAEYTDAGKQYAIGWMAQTFGIFYNTEIFSSAGVDVPETWDDFSSASAKIKSKTGLIPCSLSNNPGPSGLDFFLPLITQVTDNPQLVLDLDMQRNGASWNSQPVIKALTQVQKLVNEGDFGSGINGVTGTQASTAFYTSKAAMLYSGSWEPQGFRTNAPKSFLSKYKVMQTPAWASGKKHWCANQAGAGLSVAAGSKNKDAAVEFLKYMYEPARYADIMNKSHSMPSTVAAGQKIEDPVLKLMTSWLIQGNGCPHILFGKGSSDSASNELAGLIGGKQQPAPAAAAIQKAVHQAQGR
jgi:ABC-type glycerol-3-phosphate transport system substrate-binding protein